MCAGILQYPCWFRWGTWGCGSMFHRSWVYPHSPLSFNLCTPHSIMFRNNLDMYPLLIVSLVNGLSCLIYLFKVASLSISWSGATIYPLLIISLDHNSMEDTKTKWWRAMWLNSTGQNIELHPHVCTGILQWPWFRWGTRGCSSMFDRNWVWPHSPLSFSLCTPLSIMFLISTHCS